MDTTRRNALIQKLKAVRVGHDQKLPAEALNSLTELANMAPELVKMRAAELRKIKSAVPSRSRTVPGKSGSVPGKPGSVPSKYEDGNCGQYNTVWDAMLSLFTGCGEWEECMFVDLKVTFGVSDAENAYKDCNPDR